MGDDHSFENLLHELKELLKNASFPEKAEDIRRMFKDHLSRRTLHECKTVEDVITALCSQDLATPSCVSKLLRLANLFDNKEAADLISVYRKLSQPYASLEGTACSYCDQIIPRQVARLNSARAPPANLPAAGDVMLIKMIMYISEHFAPLWKKLVRELPIKLQVPERDILALAKTRCVERQDAVCHQCACFEAFNFWRKCYPKGASVTVLRDAAAKDVSLKEIADALSSDSHQNFASSSRCEAIRSGLHQSKLSEGPTSVDNLVQCLIDMEQHD